MSLKQNDEYEENLREYLDETHTQTFSISCPVKDLERAIRQIALFINSEKDE